MRSLLIYLRQCFCRHKWTFDEGFGTSKDGYGGRYQGAVVYKRCEKCGFESSRKKWKV